MQMTVKYGVRAVGDQQSRAESLDQLLSLVDFILAGRRSHVDSLRDATRSAALQQYEADRLAYIQLFSKSIFYFLFLLLQHRKHIFTYARCPISKVPNFGK